jgi:tetratricopeptide (TPR) repeat protein
MWHLRRIFLALLLISFPNLEAQGAQNHDASASLGSVSFTISCRPEVQQVFNKGVALLHSFAYAAAMKTFQSVAEQDSRCAMAHWGIAMAYFHELWEPPLLPSTIATAQREIRLALQAKEGSAREQKFIHALSLIYQDSDSIPYRKRALRYEWAMKELAADYPKDVEAQVFYALALLANASPKDKAHANQKQAAEVLEPLRRACPQHPGVLHYLIHAYDNEELAARGLSAAREYSKIAPSAPHALHMPSHIFTRLGLWDDSISSNVSARNAAHLQGDTGEELHAMDYLEYAYLQSGRDVEAAELVQQVKGMSGLNISDFKIGYAATAIPVRYIVERKQWADATSIAPQIGAPPQVAAIDVWARGLGLSRSGHIAEARLKADRLRQLELQLRGSGNEYWAGQVDVMAREVMAWSAQSAGNPIEAASIMRKAADEEDAVEKLPVTPGPIVPAREQLADLLLEQGHPEQASKEYTTALQHAPGRRGALQGAAEARELLSHK